MEGITNSAWPRRRLGATGLAVLAALGWGDPGGAKHKHRKEGKRKHNGGGGRCRGCLRGPFSVTVSWTGNQAQFPVLFVPPENAATGPAPWTTCIRSEDVCGSTYPFVCIDEGPLHAPGETVAAVARRLAGTYEYWLPVSGGLAAGELQVALRDGAGSVVRAWSGPETPAGKSRSWHVFNVDGAGRIASVDTLIDGDLPDIAHAPNTNTCADET